MAVSDTSPEAEAVQLELIRRMTPEQRLARVFEMTEFVRSLAREEERRRHPNAPEREITTRLAARLYSRDLVIRAFGWDPYTDKWARIRR